MIDIARVAAVTIDMDGTLYPLRRTRWRFAWRAWRQELGPMLRVSKAIQDECVGRDFSNGAALRAALAHEVATRMGIADGAAAAGLRTIDDDILPGALRPSRDDLRQSLQRCPRPLAVVSDRGGIAAKLHHLQLEDVPWRLLMSADDCGAFKPHPRVLQDVASSLSLPTTALLHLGDRDDTDGAAARAVGAQFILCDGPDDVVRALLLLG